MVSLKNKVHTSVYPTLLGHKAIRYHNTDVVKFNDQEIILNTGGWFTATTKKRMNQAALEFNLPFSVRQTKGEWFADVYENHDLRKSIPFQSDILILRR